MKPFKEEPLHNSSSPKTLLEGDVSKPKFTSTFNDGQSFKNLSVYVSQLPATPNRFREKYVRSRMPETPSHAPKEPVNVTREELLTLELKNILIKLYLSVEGDLGSRVMTHLAHFYLFAKINRNKYLNERVEMSKGLLYLVKNESERTDLSRRMDDLRQSMQPFIKKTCFPTRTQEVVAEKGLAANRNEDWQYTYPPGTPTITTPESWGQSSQKVSMPNSSSRIRHIRSAHTSYDPPMFSPMPRFRSVAQISYTPRSFTPLPPPPESATLFSLLQDQRLPRDHFHHRRSLGSFLQQI
jgi:hypothetical protein